jgi:hypothetical protein
MSKSLANLYERKKDDSLFKKESSRDSVELSMLHYESEFKDKRLSDVDISKPFRTIYMHTSNGMRNATIGICRLECKDEQTKSTLIRYAIAEKIDIRLIATFMELHDHIESTTNMKTCTDHVRCSIIAFVDLLIVSMLAANDIAGLGTNERAYANSADFNTYEDLYSIDPWTYVDKDKKLRFADATDDPGFANYRKAVTIFEQFSRVFNAKDSVITIEVRDEIKTLLFGMWRDIRNMGSTPRDIRNIWRYTTCMLSLLSQRRAPWNYVFMDEAPLEGLLLFRLTYTKNANLIGMIITDLFIPKTICAVFHKMEQCLLQRANEAIYHNRIEPVLRTQGIPLAGQMLKLNKQNKLELMKTSDMRAQVTASEYNLYALVKLTLDSLYDFERFKNTYLVTASTNLALNNNYFTWILSRNMINDSDTIISLDTNADERIMQLLGSSMAINFFSRLTKQNRDMLKSK